MLLLIETTKASLTLYCISQVSPAACKTAIQGDLAKISYLEKKLVIATDVIAPHTTTNHSPSSYYGIQQEWLNNLWVLSY